MASPKSSCLQPSLATGMARTAEAGVVLIEALVGVLIFSMGILALIGLQTVAVGSVTQSQMRSDAQRLADELVGEMWTIPACQVGEAFGPGGSRFDTWKSRVAATLPGNIDPTVVIDANNRATITVSWKAPNETDSHNYVAETMILGSGPLPGTPVCPIQCSDGTWLWPPDTLSDCPPTPTPTP